ncbi:MAG: efflux RND transporter periplasmic adaptor subunit [Clostridia bacterium]|nr:efflux RND transporter periplasmic adaptor subunit [Clostridia bacterium]
MNKNRLMILAVIALVIVFGLSKRNTSDINAVESKTIPVEVMELMKSDISEEYYSVAMIEANKNVNIVPKVQGEVKDVYVKVGDKVKKGQKLFKIDSYGYQNKVNTLEANLKNANVNVSTAKTNLALATGGQKDEKIVSAEASYTKAKLAFEDAEDTYNNMKDLFKTGGISKNDLDKAKLGYDNAKANYDNAKVSYDVFIKQGLDTSIEVSKNQYESALANKESLEAQIRDAKEALNNTVVTSPIDGVVASVEIEAGEITQGSAVTIVNTETMKVSALASESVIKNVSIGDKTRVYIESIAKEVEGEIISKSPVAINNKYEVEVLLNNEDKQISEGMFAEIYLKVGEEDKRFIVDRKHLVKNEGKTYIYVIEDMKAIEKEVEVGAIKDGKVEIKGALTEGEVLIVKGQNYVDDGTEVNVVK